MSKKIRQNDFGNRVRTFTTGRPEGDRPDFNVFMESSPRYYKKGAELVIEHNGEEFEFDGRHARTIYDVLSRHYEAVDQ
jgi:hypothetical protein